MRPDGLYREALGTNSGAPLTYRGGGAPEKGDESAVPFATVRGMYISGWEPLSPR
jgi:hypothetical protein